MSIIVAYVDDDRTYIGSDTLATSQSGQCWNVGGKWYEGEDHWWFGAIGDTRVTDVVRTSMKMLTSSGPAGFTPDLFVERLLRQFEDAGRMRSLFPSETTCPVWFDGGILACPGRAWEIDCQLGLTPVTPCTPVARGAGAQVAIGTVWGMQHAKYWGLGLAQEAEPHCLVSWAIQAAEAHNVHVRGIWTHTVERPAINTIHPPRSRVVRSVDPASEMAPSGGI
jgi:hypothetical protein